MIGIKMRPNIPVHYQKGNTLQKGNPPLQTYNLLLIIFTILANVFAYMTIIVRSIYNFVNCLQFNIRYEKVERPVPVDGALVSFIFFTCDF